MFTINIAVFFISDVKEIIYTHSLTKYVHVIFNPQFTLTVQLFKGPKQHNTYESVF